jgi:Zn-finger nucleic acid-binding protein
VTRSPACPACLGTTERREWADLVGFECTHCAGLWIQGGDLAEFLSRHSRTPSHADLIAKATEAKTSTRSLRCPLCGAGTFHTLTAVGVEMDLCGKCGGAFLDGDEIASFLRRGRSKRGPVGSVLDAFNDIDSVAKIVADIVGAVA